MIKPSLIFELKFLWTQMEGEEPNPVIPFDHININTLSALLRKSELVILIICFTILVLVDSADTETNVGKGKWINFAAELAIWINLILYMWRFYYHFERFRWLQYLFVEIVYFALWALLLIIAAYDCLPHRMILLKTANGTFLYFLLLFICELLAYIMYKRGFTRSPIDDDI